MTRLPTVSNHFNSFRKKRSGSIFLSILCFGFLYLLSLGFVFPLRFFLDNDDRFVLCEV